MVREDQPGDKRLVAYVVGDGNVDGWREYLKAKLPSYMVPSDLWRWKLFHLQLTVKLIVRPYYAGGKAD
ncbi:hypothetical protein HFP67_28090 [Bacillus sp. CB102A.1]